MNWASFYLGAFLVGFMLSVLSVLGGALHAGHVHAHQLGRIGKMGGKGGVSPFNLGTFAAFLAWFGGTGFLLERFSDVWVYLGLFISMAHFNVITMFMTLVRIGISVLVIWYLSQPEVKAAFAAPQAYAVR